MTIIRGLAILIALFVLAPNYPAWAQAGTAPRAELSQSQLIPVGDVPFARRCPRLCVEWFDGCNTCTCGKGRTDVCTDFVCRWHRRARCLRYGF